METKKRPESERAKPDSGGYLASARACQGAFSSHPKGLTLPALRFVEVLDRGRLPRSSHFSLRSIRDRQVAILVSRRFEP